MGRASFFSQSWTVRTSRPRYAAISFQESRRSGPLNNRRGTGVGPRDSGICYFRELDISYRKGLGRRQEISNVTKPGNAAGWFAWKTILRVFGNGRPDWMARE